MITIIEKAYYDLKRIGFEHQMDNAIMMSKIEEVMPSKMKDECESTC